ncbi:MAG: hypothetical protein K2L72_01315, partial [Clostridia bacterium]|nr:hypothetical protein [Clostridia bacterium]
RSRGLGDVYHRQAYTRAKKLLTENRSILDNMARVLVERETIYTAEVDMLMKGADWNEVLAYMESHDNGMPDNPFGNQPAEEQSEEATPSEEKPDKKD